MQIVIHPLQKMLFSLKLNKMTKFLNILTSTRWAEDRSNIVFGILS